MRRVTGAKTTWRIGQDSVLDHIAMGQGGCWIWTRSLNTRGYGFTRVKVSGRWRSVCAHRLSYEELVGPIPAGLVIDHLCRIRRCVNPSHMEPVTPRENTLRSPLTVAGVHARKTHCVNGHPLTTENTYRPVHKNGSSWRQCKTCANTPKAVTK